MDVGVAIPIEEVIPVDSDCRHMSGWGRQYLRESAARWRRSLSAIT